MSVHKAFSFKPKRVVSGLKTAATELPKPFAEKSAKGNPLPFLHPKREPGSELTNNLLGTMARDNRPPPRILRALSGDTPTETLRRFGRATSAQNKEFSARVHPLSGRMETLKAGDESGVGMMRPYSRTAERAKEFAERTKNPEYRNRAKKIAEGEVIGPKRIEVHNHPTYGGKFLRRSPSSPDIQGAIKNGAKGAVTTPIRTRKKGAPRTNITFFGEGPTRVPKRVRQTGDNNNPAIRHADSERGTHNLFGRRAPDQRAFDYQDGATQNDYLLRMQNRDEIDPVNRVMGEGMLRSSRRHDRKKAVKDVRTGEPMDYDEFVASRTRDPRRATFSGVHTRTVQKNLSAFGIDHGWVAKSNPVSALGNGIAKPVYNTGTKVSAASLRRLDALPANPLAWTKEQTKLAERAVRLGEAGKKIASAGQAMSARPALTGSAALAGVGGAGGGTAYAVNRKKNSA